METGRKFWITAAVEVMIFVAILLFAYRAPAAVAVTVASIGIPAMATLAATFIAGNASITWQAIKSQQDASTVSETTTHAVNETVTREITARRAATDDGTELTD